MRERVPAVLSDGGVVQRDDRDLIADGGVAEVDGLVVDGRLQRRVKELGVQEHRADGKGHEGQARDDQPLTRVALRKHRGSEYAVARSAEYPPQHRN